MSPPATPRMAAAASALPLGKGRHFSWGPARCGAPLLALLLLGRSKSEC